MPPKAGLWDKGGMWARSGAEEAVDYRGAWDDEIRELTGGEDVDVVLDAQAGP